MRYTLSNTINKPLSEVAEKFQDKEGAKEWMEGLTSIEPVSGEPGKKGSTSYVHFLHKGKEMKMLETILEENLPNQIKFSYTSGFGYNEVELLFEEISESVTKQTTNNYFQLKGFMKIMGLFMSGLFKKQSMKYMDGFKKFCEK